MSLLSTKQKTASESLNATLNSLVSQFTTAVTGLQKIADDAKKASDANVKKIEELQAENAQLSSLTERAAQISENLSKLLS